MLPYLYSFYVSISCLVFTGIVASSSLEASPNYNYNSLALNDFDSTYAAIYADIMALRTPVAAEALAKIPISERHYALHPLLAHYIDFVRAFITETDSALEQLTQAKDIRLAAIKAGTYQHGSAHGDAWQNFAQAEILWQTALVRLKFEQYYKAFWEVRKALKLLEQNSAAYPNFLPNLKTLGVLHTLVGTAPDTYQWGLNIIGLQGSVPQGLQELQTFEKITQTLPNTPFYTEAYLMHTFLLAFVGNNNTLAWQRVQQIPTANNLLNSFVAADLAYRTQHFDAAKAYLEQRPTGSNYAPFYLLDYLLGCWYLNDFDEQAVPLLQKFVQRFKGRHFIKDAYRRLAWAALLNDNMDSYHLNMKRCLQQGKKLVDNDLDAYHEAKTGSVPLTFLLKIRLLYDGGHYNQALKTIQNVPDSLLANTHVVLALPYRKARIAEAQKQTATAIQYYKQCITNQAVGTKLPYYYAPKACLQLGNYYAASGQAQIAASYYKKALLYHNYNYENSIRQAAKAGLSRLQANL